MPGFDSGLISGNQVSVMYAQNVDFTGSSLTAGSPQVTQNGQLLIGANAAPYIRVATLTSGTGINIVNGPGTITINSTNTGSVTQLNTDSGNTTPSSGAITIQGGQNINTSGAGSTVTINVNNQIKQPDGTSGAPSYSFTSSTNSGIRWNTLKNAVQIDNAGNDNFYVSVDTIGAQVRISVQSAVGLSTLVGQTSGTLSLNTVYVGVDTTAIRTITLPANPNFTGLWYIIKDQTGTANANNITVAGNGHNIDGGANLIINTSFGVARLLWDGTQWYTI